MFVFVVLTFRSFIIFKRFVHVTFDGQKLTCVDNTCYCCIATILNSRVCVFARRQPLSRGDQAPFCSLSS